jgi:Ni,Fe-hydrogenase I large subunit
MVEFTTQISVNVNRTIYTTFAYTDKHIIYTYFAQLNFVNSLENLSQQKYSTVHNKTSNECWVNNGCFENLSLSGALMPGSNFVRSGEIEKMFKINYKLTKYTTTLIFGWDVGNQLPIFFNYLVSMKTGHVTRYRRW